MSSVIYYSAPWCMPCKTLKPAVEKFCKENNVAFRDVNIDAPQPGAVVPSALTSVPSMMVVNDQGVEMLLSGGYATITALKQAVGS